MGSTRLPGKILKQFYGNKTLLETILENLRKIDQAKIYLKKNYGQYHTGFSDHTIGISAPAIAVGIGAEIIEKHIKKDNIISSCHTNK